MDTSQTKNGTWSRITKTHDLFSRFSPGSQVFLRFRKNIQPSSIGAGAAWSDMNDMAAENVAFVCLQRGHVELRPLQLELSSKKGWWLLRLRVYSTPRHHRCKSIHCLQPLSRQSYRYIEYRMESLRVLRHTGHISCQSRSVYTDRPLLGNCRWMRRSLEHRNRILKLQWEEK